MDLHTEQLIQDMVDHRVSTTHGPALAITDEDTDGEEEARPQATRGHQVSSDLPILQLYIK